MNNRNNNQNKPNNNNQKPNKPQVGSATPMSTSRGQAVRAQRRSQADAQRIANQYQTAEKTQPRRANFIDDQPRLRIIGLGGMDHGGSKNMILVEYKDEAVIMDCGNELGV
ncbi:MAG: hypothetical protein WDN66_02135 [Candidatus Saccharibacteria bacterium]